MAAENVLRTSAVGKRNLDVDGVEAEFFPVTIRGLIATVGFVRVFPQFKLVVNPGRAPATILVWQMQSKPWGAVAGDSLGYQPSQ
jgi:hypothetical protein